MSARGANYWNSQKEPQLCECGCGDYASPGRRLIYGHHSEESKRKLSAAHKGKQLSNETRQKLSEINKAAWRSKKHREKMRDALTGRKFSEKARRNMSVARTGVKISEKTKLKIGIANMKPRVDGYCEVWGDKEYVNDLRGPACEQCGMTNMMAVHIYGYRLATHHANGKQNCAPIDITTLCGSCHMKLHHKLRKKERMVV